MISGIATVRITFHAGWKRPRGRRSAMASSGTKTLSRTIVCEPVARMPSAAPVVGERNAGSGEWNGEVEDLPALLGIVKRRRGHQHAALGRTAAERLPGADPEAAVGALDRAVRFHPVIGAGGNQNRLVGGDPLQQLFSRPAVAVMVDGRGDQMLMHRQRQRGRRAIMGEPAQERAHGAVAHSAAAELGGNKRRKNLVLLENVVVLGDEKLAWSRSAAPSAKRGPMIWTSACRSRNRVMAASSDCEHLPQG